MNSIFRIIEAILIWIMSLTRRLRGTGRPTIGPLPGKVGRVLSAGDGDDPFAISAQMLEKHFYVLGSTGSGKTNLILKLFEQDLERGVTTVVVDLRGDLAQGALAVCREKGIDPQRVTLLDLREKSRIVGFNPLAGSGEPHVRALHIIDTLRSESDSWGVQLEETLRNSLLLLAHAKGTLTQLNSVLEDRSYAKTLLTQCGDSAILGFFDRFLKLSDEKRISWTMPVLNKVTPLLATPGLRAVLVSPSPIDIDKLLGHPGQVLLVSLAVDELHRSSRMVGSLIIAAISRSMFARVTVPENRRNSVRLYIDEFESMAVQSFESLIAEGRRFKLSLILSHQNLAQLPAKLRSVIRNNVGLQGLFCCGFQDATELERELPDWISREDLIRQRPGELFLLPRGDDPLQIKADRISVDVSSVEFAKYRSQVLDLHSIPLNQVAVPKKGNNRPVVKNIVKPWGLKKRP